MALRSALLAKQASANPPGISAGSVSSVRHQRTMLSRSEEQQSVRYIS